jgi:hypothetical protein
MFSSVPFSLLAVALVRRIGPFLQIRGCTGEDRYVEAGSFGSPSFVQGWTNSEQSSCNRRRTTSNEQLFSRKNAPKADPAFLGWCFAEDGAEM